MSKKAKGNDKDAAALLIVAEKVKAALDAETPCVRLNYRMMTCLY